MKRFFPFLELRSYTPSDARLDVQAALAVTFMSVPQGVAYAVIAGLPPAMGLYAGALPAIIGSLMRSSRHVVSGPTNAISLLVGTAVASTTADPVTAAATLALTVGIFQVLAGVLSLGAIIDYISSAVVLGYIVGAGILIAIGQLPNITATARVNGNVFTQVTGWAQSLDDTNAMAVAIALGTAGGMLLLGRFAPKVPAAITAMAIGITLSWAFDLGAKGLPLVHDLSPVPQGLPPFSVPDLGQIGVLLPIAVAATVLSLIESSAVGRAIAGRTGQRLDTSVDFWGQGLSNLAAAFFGGYPTSGSLSRSALNERAGASTRAAGALSGVFMIAILLFLGPIVDMTPVASLAGVLLIVAMGLVDIPRIRRVLNAGWDDRLAFIATVGGTWTLSLDKAIYLGAAISIIMFLRRASFIVVRELGFDNNKQLRERSDTDAEWSRSERVRILHIDGNLFFGAANSLRSAIDAHLMDPEIQVLVVRLKRAQDLDVTTAEVFESVAARLKETDRTLILAGMQPSLVVGLQRTGVAAAVGQENMFPSQSTWFAAMRNALQRAHTLSKSHEKPDCPLTSYLEQRPAADPSKANP